MVMAKSENNLVTKDIKVSASPELWEEFEAWMAKQSCTTVADGVRTAMRQVTKFNPESQEKTAGG